MSQSTGILHTVRTLRTPRVQKVEPAMANQDALIRYLMANVSREMLPHTPELLAEQLLLDPNFHQAAAGFTAEMITETFIASAFPMARFDALLVPFVASGVQIAVRQLESEGVPAWIAYAGVLVVALMVAFWIRNTDR